VPTYPVGQHLMAESRTVVMQWDEDKSAYVCPLCGDDFPVTRASDQEMFFQAIGMHLSNEHPDGP